MMQVEFDHSESLEEEETLSIEELESDNDEQVVENTKTQPLTVEEATQLNDQREKLNFRPFTFDGQTYFIGVGSVFEIKPKFCNEGSYKVFINDKYYLQDTNRNECWKSMTRFVTVWRERLGLCEGATAYDGWKHVNLVLPNDVKIANHYLYRVVKTKTKQV